MSLRPTIAALEIVRSFNAPRQTVFDAFTSFEMMKSWFGPGTCEVQGGSVDFTEGGAYRFDLKTQMGEMTVSGRYTSITPPEKIAFTWKWEDDEDWEQLESLVVIEFRDHGASTEVRLVQTGFPSEESRGNHEHGWCGSFDKLAPGA